MRKMLLVAALLASAACSHQNENDTGQVSPKPSDTGRVTRTSDTTNTGAYQPSTGRTSPKDTTRIHTDTTMNRTGASDSTRLKSDSLKAPGDSAMIHHAVPDSSTQMKHDSM